MEIYGSGGCFSPNRVQNKMTLRNFENLALKRGGQERLFYTEFNCKKNGLPYFHYRQLTILAYTHLLDCMKLQ